MKLKMKLEVLWFLSSIAETAPHKTNGLKWPASYSTREYMFLKKQGLFISCRIVYYVFVSYNAVGKHTFRSTGVLYLARSILNVNIVWNILIMF